VVNKKVELLAPAGSIDSLKGAVHAGADAVYMGGALFSARAYADNPGNEEMKDALHRACADFVLDLPAGLDSPCSESGGGLSEGQAQRIAIARALLREGSIMLFDEATSALDPETERQLLQNILANHDKTILFITHRPAVVDYCDQVLHIEKI